MRPRADLLRSCPLIGIADEPFDDGSQCIGTHPHPSTAGFEIVPAWQARPPRRLRRIAAALPLIAVAAAAAAAVEWGDETAAVRARPAAAGSRVTATTQALVVHAAAVDARSARSAR